MFGSDSWQENKWDTLKGKRKVIARFSTNLKPSNTTHSTASISVSLVDAYCSLLVAFSRASFST
jgi:hypothetical protein